MRSIAFIVPGLVASTLICSGQTPATPAPKPAAPKPPAVAAAKPRPSPTVGAKPVPRVNPKLKNPALANETAPENYKVKFTTTKGDIVITANRALGPVGADRFWNLVKIGFFSDIYFFRQVPGFVTQFGISSDPGVSAAWLTAKIKDDAVRDTNKRGSISFATAGPGSRTTQLFINLADNANLDGMGFSPFAFVSEGLDVVDKLNQEYGQNPDQQAIQMQGGAYLTKNFARLDKIVTAVVTEPVSAPAKPVVAPAKPVVAPAKPAMAKPVVPAAPKPAAAGTKPVVK